uniref:ADAMTS cysteine-rich domain-containing protein n=1 Tax=Arion vulgaris TaxID=1028688 RepID=A0A0B6YZJ0_9EUPU
MNVVSREQDIYAMLFILVCSLAKVAADTEGHWTAWGEMTPCSVTCGIGTTSMKRVWIPGPNEAPRIEPFTLTQVSPCSDEMYPDCPQDGVWLEWMEWNRCTKACGTGLRERQRECRPPMYGGKPCDGDMYSKEDCSREPCPPLPKQFDMSQCKEGSNFTCVSLKMCIPLIKKCDTIVHCHDGSDEENCLDLSLIRGGNVRYDLRLYGNGAVASFFNPNGQIKLTMIMILFYCYQFLFLVIQ